VSKIDTSVELFGHRNSIPLGVAPTAMQRLAHTDGEIGTARACKKMGIAMGLSSFATTTLEEVAEANGDNPHVLQLYLFEEREHSVKLLKRAKEAGYKAVFLTVDTPILGRRNLEIRNQFKLPSHFKIPNFEMQGDENANAEAEQRGAAAESRGGSTAGYTDGEGKRVVPRGPISFHSHAANPTLNWERDIAWLKKECGDEMQVWVKGIATGEDALLAVHHGVDGIVVSNHGGRQLSKSCKAMSRNNKTKHDYNVLTWSFYRWRISNLGRPPRSGSSSPRQNPSPRRRRDSPWYGRV
jgi:(S)-2-hydroxy-acid oxidase